jgi:ketosteroid isomerase-like protein
MPDDASNSQMDQQVLDREAEWAAAIKRQDSVAAAQYLADDYVLAIAVEGQPLQLVPRAAWLSALKDYQTNSYQVDTRRVQVYGSTAVVFMLFTQQALVRGQDRSGQFAITDIWIQQGGTWRVAERHSSRPEGRAAIRPQ